ncbi:hypothetical protein HIM_07181 [Hirsutella minnesotensis 3608]|uniref:Vps72/YL1 C-terminal domain-containing protein n=1 Tax=Hirsutella minnesotensis 3608 TaxID=1043627 RepID=A0A0F7ZZ06_9HYPO|nr:hypothetical protein HIM_07181 [Hirsutella minnesotensis 3608]
MDTDSKTSGMDPSQMSDSSSSDMEAEQPPTEWLATTRERRSTAGNRMKSMLANEEPDSDLELLFAEDENDQGFSDVDPDGSDVQMDSSSDEEDDNNANQDDLEGEKELERQAKERRAAQRKRTAREAIPAKFRKKVRIDSVAPAAPAPRPKKKSERTSWLPSPADLPTRASSRKTTRISKEHLHRQMVEREARRLKQLAMMEKKAARLEAMKKPPMTQAERLAEAAVVEKRNSKSLNRWEEAEKQREEERRAKLAALNNRTLKGPVITFWSGVREWKDALGQHVTLVEAKPKRKREKPDKAFKVKDKEGNAMAGNDDNTIIKEGVPTIGDKTTPPTNPSLPPESQASPGSKDDVSRTKPAPLVAADHHGISNPQDSPSLPSHEDKVEPSKAQAPSIGVKQKESGRLVALTPAVPTPHSVLSASPGGLAAPAPPPQALGNLAAPSTAARPSSVLAAPVLVPPPGMTMDLDGTRTSKAPTSGVLAPPDTMHQLAPPSAQALQQDKPVSQLAPGLVNATPEVSQVAAPKQQQQPSTGNVTPTAKSTSPSASEAPTRPPEATGGSTTARNAIIYQGFDQNAIRDKTIQTQILFGRKMTKLAKPPPSSHCVITDHPARYRDPKTGLPFYNACAYREIQRLYGGNYRWSRLLGAWVGSGERAARGVPERFLRPETDEERAQRLEERERRRNAEQEKAKEKEAESVKPAPAEAAPLTATQPPGPAPAPTPGPAVVHSPPPTTPAETAKVEATSHPQNPAPQTTPTAATPAT